MLRVLRFFLLFFIALLILVAFLVLAVVTKKDVFLYIAFLWFMIMIPLVELINALL